MTSQAEPGESLALHGHRIVPVAKHEGSVRRWRCLDCDEEVADAGSYLHRNCTAGE